MVTLDLIINNNDNTSSSVTACDEFTWDGQTYTESGEYTNTYTNTNGCDSTHTLNLTINNEVVFFEDVSACGSYEWNDTTYTQTGTYYYNGGVSNNYSIEFSLDNDQSVSFGNFQLPTTYFSVQFWFKPNLDFNSGNDYPKPLVVARPDDNQDVSLYLMTTGGIRFQIGDSLNGYQNIETTTSSWSSDQWYYISATYDNSNSLKIYVDGELENTSDSFLSNLSTIEELTIASDPTNEGTTDVNFDGLIDELRLWSKGLSEQEILYFKNCSPSNNELGLVGYWNFEEGQGDTVFDLSVNENNGTINGATYSTDVPEQSCQLTTVNNCDSVAVLNLTITQPDTSFTDVTVCDSYEWNGETYIESGVYEYSNIESSDNNYSMNFDGEDDYLDLSLNVNNDFSFVGWLNHNQFQNGNNYILESPTGSTIRLSAYGCGSTSLATEWVLGMNGENTNHCGNTILNANNWFHVAVTQLQDSVRFYINGQLDYTFYEPIAISRTLQN